MLKQYDLQATVERARNAADRHDWLEALSCWEAVLTSDPSYAVAYAGAGNALRELGRLDEAERILGDGAERFPDSGAIAVARAWLANARHNWPEALSRWERLRERFPENPWCCFGNINALRGAGRPDQAEELIVIAESILADSKQRGLNGKTALAAEMALAKARQDWNAVRATAQKMNSADTTRSAHAFLALSQACFHLGNADEADGAASQALSMDPTLTEAVVVRAWVATERGDGEAALAYYRKLAELAPGAVRWRLKVIQLLNRFGRVHDALSELDKVRAQWPNDPMVRVFLQNYGPAAEVDARDATETREGIPGVTELEELRALAFRAPGPEEQKRPLIVADPHRDVLIGEKAGAQTVVLIFTGSNDSVSMPLPLFDRYLATLEITAVYLKDFKRLRFLRGIQSLSEDYEGTLAALRRLLKSLGIARVCTIGNCDGGFAAIRYGVELGADRIGAFGAPTFSPEESLSKIEQARNFMKNRLAASVPSGMMDLKPFIETRWSGTQIELFYEEEDARDRIQAMHLADLPGVRLHPQAGQSNHYLLRKLALGSEDFCAMLGNLLGL
jgi:tetratricopeptide (TPR) repeat protein